MDDSQIFNKYYSISYVILDPNSNEMDKKDM